MEERPPLRGPEPNLEPPTEELKLIGTPRIEETDEPVYSVHIELSRKLTAGEQDYVAGWGTPPRSPAGWVKIERDLRHLTVTEHHHREGGTTSRLPSEDRFQDRR